MAKKFTMSISEDMYAALEKERQKRKLRTIQEIIRFLLAEYLKEKST
ncbi:MAG: ribbon-helix-helix protein, CopG family [Candidatus Jordarchaeaceae archaeon]